VAVNVLKPKLSLSDNEAIRNGEQWNLLTDDLDKLRATVALGGPERSRERHVERGKLLPRDRVMQLLDPGTPFLELSPLAAHGLYDDDINGAGLITGIGQIEGRQRLFGGFWWCQSASTNRSVPG